jgi:hypothetical protein
VKSRSTFLFSLSVLVFLMMTGNLLLFFIINSADPPLYFKLETTYFYLQILSFFLVPFLAGAIWRMANTDLKSNQTRLTFPSVHKTTRVAKYLGVIGTFISPFIALMGLFVLLTSARTAAVKDAMMQHLVDLGANAYQYRLDPAIQAVEGASYIGYSIPSHLSSDEYGTYTATAVYRDSIRFLAEISLGFPGSISVVIDSTGRPTESWAFSDNFQF